MASTFVSLHYHIVFSTKNREPLIHAGWRSRLHEYIGGSVRGLGGFTEGIGGTVDHVHLLIALKASHCVSDVVRELKKAATQWVREAMGVTAFSWQEGYGAFTVSARDREAVRNYIANQEEHHRTRTFAEEFRHFLDRAGIPYEEEWLS